MTTTIIKSIGANGRDYSTIQAWVNALPANLIAADQQWIGQCYNDAEFNIATSPIYFNGLTGDATRNVILTTAPGHAFRDRSDVQSAPLRYDASRGVAVTSSALSNPIIQTNGGFVTISNIQFRSTAASGSTNGYVQGTTNGVVTVENCLFDLGLQASTNAILLRNAGSVIRNTAIIIRTTTGNGVSLGAGTAMINCTLVRASDVAPAGTAITVTGGTATIKNCGLFGFTTAFAGPGTANADGHNATDQASAPGSTGNLVGLAPAFQFLQAAYASGAYDLRLRSGSALIDAGIADATNAASDIAGTARPQNAGTDIGAWEYTAIGASAGVSAAPVLGACALLAAFPLYTVTPVSALAGPSIGSLRFDTAVPATMLGLAGIPGLGAFAISPSDTAGTPAKAPASGLVAALGAAVNHEVWSPVATGGAVWTRISPEDPS